MHKLKDHKSDLKSRKIGKDVSVLEKNIVCIFCAKMKIEFSPKMLVPVVFVCTCNSSRIGQNVQNERPVQRSP